jgi:hypothetical protein
MVAEAVSYRSLERLANIVHSGGIFGGQSGAARSPSPLTRS